MTREQVLTSIQLKKRFCKDCNLSIAVFDNPYFYERLCALDILYDCVDKFDQFCIELMAYPDEQSYFEYYNSVKDAMITHIKENAAFQEFNNQSFKATDKPVDVSKRNLYVEPNDKGVFVSIDMRKANFSALKHYSRDIFDGCDTWEEYVGKFTDSKHIANSKYIRQVVLGACNPKRQIQYEHHLMSILCLHIQQTLNDDALDIYSLGEDEIIITVENPNEPPNFRPNFSLKDLKKAVASCPEGIGSLVRIEMFDLYKVGNDGWMKNIYGDESDNVDFKCVNAEIFHQIVKHYFGQPITENDLVFYHNGQLAKFMKEVDNPW